MTQHSAFLWTLTLELPVILMAARYWQRPPRRAAIAGCLASGLSHPLAWTVALNMAPTHYHWGWYLIEAVVCLFEAGILFWLLRLSPGRALWLSLAANSVSALAGKWLF